jgi:hypothetical protein
MMRNRLAPHIDFAELNGLLDKRLPSNIDMVMERHGRFLIGEWKRPDEKIALGQQILLKQFAKLHNFTVIVIIGDTDNGMSISKVWQLLPDNSFKIITTTLNGFKQFLKEWDNDKR